MKRHILWITLFWLILSPLFPVQADDRVSEITDGIQKRYGGLPGLTVPYNREIITRSMSLLGDQTNQDQAAGLILFKPPYCLRVEQKTPKPEAIITDGTTLWWYVPDKKQVFVYPSEKTGQELRLFSDIFRGLKEVQENFAVEIIGSDQAEETELKLVPKPPWSQIEYITLSVDKSSFQITVLEIHHYLGDITRFRLGEPSVKEKFEEGFCKFEVPDGVKVIREVGQNSP